MKTLLASTPLLRHNQNARPLRVRILGDNLLHNVNVLRQYVKNSGIIAMVKADAYGHGALAVAETLAPHVDYLGVASFDEALQLKIAGCHTPIVLNEGFFKISEVPAIIAHGFSIVIHHESQLAALEALELQMPISVWFKIDVGMGRLGFNPESFLKLLPRIQKAQWLTVLGIWGHLPCADDLNATDTLTQCAVFEQCTKGLTLPKSLANSAALLRFPAAHYDFVRPGILLYGISPFADKSGTDLGLKPVMVFESELIAIKEIPPGSTVGYGATWKAPIGKKTRIGIVAAGYADGYPRTVPSGTPVLIAGERVPLVGRVSMDMMAVLLPDTLAVEIGETVTLWGPGLPVEEIALAAGTIPYELCCHRAQRVPVTVC